MDDQVPEVARAYVPPSTTVIRTQSDGWYYVPETFDEAIQMIEYSGNDEWIMFSVVSNEATKIMLRKDAITAVVDLTPIAHNG